MIGQFNTMPHPEDLPAELSDGGGAAAASREGVQYAHQDHVDDHGEAEAHLLGSADPVLFQKG